MADPFPHIASLNLFREPDGTHEITVAGGNLDLIRHLYEDGLAPIDIIENLIIDAAERMNARKITGATSAGAATG